MPLRPKTENSEGTISTSAPFSMNGLSLEEQFLLCAIRMGIRGKAVEESDFPTPVGELDWAKIVEIAFENRVATLLYFTLSKVSKSGLIPAREANILKKFYFETAQKNLRIKHGLNRILADLAAKDIEVVVLKGAVLAFSMWPNMITRQMHDIDIVVPSDRAEEAIRTVIDLGYETTNENSIEWHLEHTREFPPLLDPVNDVNVEVHYRFFTPNAKLKIDEQPFWEHAVKADFGGVSARVLAPEELMILLCLHVSVGHFLGDNMRSLLDIVLLTEKKRDSLDERVLKKYLEDTHLGPLVAFPVMVCARYLGVDFTSVFENASNALSLHYSGYKLRVLERAAERFLLKLKPKSYSEDAFGNLSEWALVKVSNKLILEPRVGVMGVILCFLFEEGSIHQFHHSESVLGNIKTATVRRLKLFGRFVGSLFHKERKT